MVQSNTTESIQADNKVSIDNKVSVENKVQLDPKEELFKEIRLLICTADWGGKGMCRVDEECLERIRELIKRVN